MAAPLQDGCSLESRKPISLNSQRAARRGAEVLHSNSQPSTLITAKGAEGSGRWQPEGKKTGSDSGCIPFSPILSYLLFPPLLAPQIKASSARLRLANRHTYRFFFWKHTLESLFTFMRSQICTQRLSQFFLSPSHNHNTSAQTNTNFSWSTLCVLCGFTISASPHGLVSLLPPLPERKLQ